MATVNTSMIPGNGRILVTGGAGYIGSHTLLKLLEQGHHVCVYDNFSNSSPLALERVRELAGCEFDLVKGDIRDKEKLFKTLADFQPEIVLHFAGLKSVGESGTDPLKYHEQNVAGSINLLNAMEAAKCRKIVFSSSATVYGEPRYLPFDENHPLDPTNTYGRTKLYVEGIIKDWVGANSKAGAVLLRYFNPVGAHPSGMIGEDPNGIPNNLMPFVTQVAVGKREKLSIFGDDYKTRDGTGERDYIHVEDLAGAHLAAAHFCLKLTGCEAINVGTGKGATVLELVHAFEKHSERNIPYEIVARRDGDIASSVADASKAGNLLDWRAEYDIEEMCRTAWNWQKNNPNGYAGEE